MLNLSCYVSEFCGKEQNKNKVKNKLFLQRKLCPVSGLRFMFSESVGRVFDPNAFLVDITFNHDMMAGDTGVCRTSDSFPTPTRRSSLTELRTTTGNHSPHRY